jgi:hypothetical protein
MKHRSRVLAISLALLTAMPAFAQSDLQPGFDMRLLMLAPAQDKARSCYLRRYAAAHLNSRPQQKVESIGLCVEVERLAPEEKGEPVRYVYSFDFAAKLRGRAAILTTGGECGFSHMPPEEQKRIAGKPIWCGVDCDGGGVRVEPRKDGAELRVSLERIRVSSECGGGDDDSKSFDITGGADDKVFMIPRTSVEDYRAFVGK